MSENDKILQMIADGKLTPEEGAKLLTAIKGKKMEEPKVEKEIEVKTVTKPAKGKELRGTLVIEIESGSGEEVKVRLPLRLANLAMSIMGSAKIDYLQTQGINIADILSNIDGLVDDFDGDIVNVSSPDGDEVHIYIEK